MQHRIPVRTLVSLAGLALGAAALAPLASQAQGLRVSPQIGTSRSGQPAPPAGPRQADYIVAVVNSEPITNNEVRSRMVRIEQQMAQQGGALPPRAQLARQVLERLISEKAQLQLARETGIKVDEVTVDQAEQNVARQNQIEVPEQCPLDQRERRVALAGQTSHQNVGVKHRTYFHDIADDSAVWASRFSRIVPHAL